MQILLEVATVAARTKLFIVRTTPHPPTNVTVTEAKSFQVTLMWEPGYSGCGSCEQTYTIRSGHQLRIQKRF